MMFLFVQNVSQAHATEYGDEGHSHDGIACEITLIAAEEIVVTPPVFVPVPLKTLSESNWKMGFDKVRPRIFDGRAPPPRAPPTH